ncbi:unnamed protein product [Paramecium primaurelia]|uniref:Uncharacterized protein n=1 Tax=Paramecium primaurelia TaxID=5886 RepID=A0A8S1LZK8_PARPR|nr:unnamed protein product [Paramecium primaurelia]
MSITIYFNPYSHRNTFNIIENTNKQNVTKRENLNHAFPNINPNQLFQPLLKSFSVYLKAMQQQNTFAQINLISDYILMQKNHSIYKQEWIHIQIGIKMNLLNFWIILKRDRVPENRVSRLADVEGILHFFIKTFLNNGQLNYIFDLPNFTIADFRAVCDLTSLYICNFDFEKFPVLEKYILRIFFKIPELYLTHQDYFNLISKQKYKNLFIQSILARQPEQDLINLYFHPLSSPSRAVRSLFLLATIEYNQKFIDILKSENKFDQHTQINQIKQNLKTISITDLSAVNEILLLVMANYEFNSVWCNINYICQCLKLKNILQTFLIIRM